MRNVWKRSLGLRLLGAVLAAGMAIGAGPAVTYAAPADAILAETAGITEMEIGSVYDISVEGKESWWASFTAPEDGEYAFVGYSDKQMLGELYEDAEGEDYLDYASNREFVLHRELTRGQTVYLEMCAYDGEGMEGKIEVAPFSVSNLKYAKNGTGQFSRVVQDGKVSVEVAVYNYDWESLEEGKDYKLVFVDEDGKEYDTPPARVGHYKYFARGIGDTYFGDSRKTPYDVVETNDLSVGGISCDQYWMLDGFTGVKAEVWDHVGNYLTEGKDYELRYMENTGNNYTHEGWTEAPTTPGVWGVYAQAIGTEYTGRTYLTQIYLQDPYDIGNPGFEGYAEIGRFVFYWAEDNSIQYTGEPVILPARSIWYLENEENEVVLEEGKDFHLKGYEDKDGNELEEVPVMPGTYYAVFAGDTPYTGETKQEFTIVGDEKDLSIARVGLYVDTYDENGQPVELSYDVYECDGGRISADALTPEYFDESGTKLDGTPTTGGIYQVAFIPADGSEYKNETPKVRFEICGQNDIRNQNFIHGSFTKGNAVVYTGQPLDPPNVVYYTLNEDEANYLKPGDDYVLDHLEDAEGNVLPDLTVTDVGLYWMVHKGINGYTGLDRDFFYVVSDKDIAHWYGGWEHTAYIAADEGKLLKPIISKDLAEGSTVTLEEGKDFVFDHYEVDGESTNTLPTTVGCYRAVYRALEGYTGYKSIPFFVIDPYDLSNYVGTFGNQNRITSGTGELPAATISRTKADGTKQTLKQGTDFVLTCIKKSDEKSTLTEMPKIPEEPGLYLAVYAGSNGYIGEAAIEFEVVKPDPIDISKAKVTLEKTSVTYNGKVQKPKVQSVVVNGKKLKAGTDYTIKDPSGCTNAGSYTYTITGKGVYYGTATAKFTIAKADSSIKLQAQTKTFKIKPLGYDGKVTKSGSTGEVTYAYYSDAKGTKEVKAINVKNAGTYYVRANLAADVNYKAAQSNLVKYTVNKAANKISFKVSKSKTVRAAVVKKGAKTVKLITVKTAVGTVSYKLSGVKAASFKKYFKVNTKTGKITVKKGLKKGTYTLTVTVTAKGNKNYNKLSKNVTFKIVVK